MQRPSKPTHSAIYAQRFRSNLDLKEIKYERFGAWRRNEIYFPIHFIFHFFIAVAAAAAVIVVGVVSRTYVL